ncbi:MAG: family 1 glycosylhydrolase [Spirochaetia bacterium]
MDHGVNLQGCFLWSLMDIFEWSMGFSARFGITHVDHHTQARTWKKSASWYQSVIATNGAFYRSRNAPGVSALAPETSSIPLIEHCQPRPRGGW